MDKLLLIDDEADVQYSFRRIFSSSDIELATASSGEEGLKLIPKFKPDLVLMDIRMGGMSGLETLRRVKQVREILPCILISADMDERLAEEARLAHAFSVVAKPVRSAELRRLVDLALRSVYQWRGSS